jgi:hypothetical protein
MEFALGRVLQCAAATCRVRPHNLLVAFGVTGESRLPSSEDNQIAGRWAADLQG